MKIANFACMPLLDTLFYRTVSSTDMRKDFQEVKPAMILNIVMIIEFSGFGRKYQINFQSDDERLTCGHAINSKGPKNKIFYL